MLTGREVRVACRHRNPHLRNSIRKLSWILYQSTSIIGIQHSKWVCEEEPKPHARLVHASEAESLDDCPGIDFYTTVSDHRFSPTVSHSLQLDMAGPWKESTWLESRSCRLRGRGYSGCNRPSSSLSSSAQTHRPNNPPDSKGHMVNAGADRPCE